MRPRSFALIALAMAVLTFTFTFTTVASTDTGPVFPPYAYCDDELCPWEGACDRLFSALGDILSSGSKSFVRRIRRVGRRVFKHRSEALVVAPPHSVSPITPPEPPALIASIANAIAKATSRAVTLTTTTGSKEANWPVSIMGALVILLGLLSIFYYDAEQRSILFDDDEPAPRALKALLAKKVAPEEEQPDDHTAEPNHPVRDVQ